MKQHLSAGGVLVDERGRVYLTYKKSRDEWALPKGGIEEGESELEAAEREIKEETGYQNVEALTKKPIKTSTWTFTRANSNEEEQKTTYYFLFRLKGKHQVRTPEMEEEGFSGDWFSFEEAIEQAAFDDVREVVKAARKRLS